MIVLTFALAQVFDINIILNLPIYVYVAYFVLAFCTGYIIYRLSLHLHGQFGETWKSLFDVYRMKLNDLKFNDDISAWTGGEDLLEGKTAHEKNEIIWSYLQYFKIKCPRTGDVVAPPQYLQECGRRAGDEGKHRKGLSSDSEQENR